MANTTESVKADKTPVTPKSLPELRDFEGLLYVKNNSPYKQYNIRTRLGDQRIDVELSPAGKPDSIAVLPKAALELRGFQRAWIRGTISVSADPEMEDEITLLMNQHIKATDERLAQFMSSTETPNTVRELVSKPCLQCGNTNREGVIEGGRVTQSASDVKNGIPPLCEEHSNLQHMFVPAQSINDKGETVWTFSSVTTE